jgi:[acyl-carrier-protein] S-malonyltransferase
MGGWALLFPGQGSQARGMGKELSREFNVARETFAEASDATGLDLAGICFDDPHGQLELTEFTQPCVLAASVAAWRVLHQETGMVPAVAAGHSLGEYSALVAAGALTLHDGARAVQMRGKWMQEAVPAGQGGMAAILGAERCLIEAACREAAGGQVVVAANDNAPGQIVISGHNAAVDRAIAIIKEKGGKAKKLKVSGPFHTALMQSAAEKMAELLAGVEFSGPAFPVIANVDAAPYPGSGPADLLVWQMTSVVQWRRTIEAMEERGVKQYVEAGPGTVLAGLIKRTQPSAVVLPMAEPAHLENIRKAMDHGDTR